jgi:hypothetical protein
MCNCNNCNKTGFYGNPSEIIKPIQSIGFQSVKPPEFSITRQLGQPIDSPEERQKTSVWQAADNISNILNRSLVGAASIISAIKGNQSNQMPDYQAQMPQPQVYYPPAPSQPPKTDFPWLPVLVGLAVLLIFILSNNKKSKK